MRNTTILAALLLLTSAGPLSAQRLLWEQGFTTTPTTNESEAFALALTGNHRFLLAGNYSDNLSNPGCPPRFRAYYRIYDLTGTLIREQLGRGQYSGNTDYVMTNGRVGWVTSAGQACVNNVRYSRPYVQRLTVAGDTGRAWNLAPVPPAALVNAMLAQGNKLVTAGAVVPNQGVQYQQFQLTCSDTLGNVRWQRNYPHLPFADDDASTLVPTPRGGYLLSGDTQNYPAITFNHYLVETDSVGNFRRSRSLQPLGPHYPDGSRLNYQCNALALPNAGGYLLSGVADSLNASGLHNRRGYIMRLDTALNITWVYKHPPALAGTNATQNYAYRLRLLPNGTVGLLLTDVRSTGTPDVFLVQVDVQNGRRVGFYTMSSNTQAVVIPRDWQWVGDGTLLLCGTANQIRTAYPQSYVARWDFSRTPLAARSAAAARATATFYAFPNPASGPVAFHWHLPPGQRAGAVRLYSVLGQLVRTVPLLGVAEGQQPVAGLAAGLYIARLVDEQGRGQGGAVRLVVE